MKKLAGAAAAVLSLSVAFVVLGPPASATTVGVTLSPSSVNAGETTTATIVFTSETGSDTLVIDTSGSEGQIAQPQLFNGGWMASCTGIGTNQVTCPYTLGSYPVTVTAVITVPADVLDTSWTVGATMVSDNNLDLATLAITPDPTTTTSSTSTTSTSTTSTSTTSTTAPSSTTTTADPTTTSTSTPGSTSTTGGAAVGDAGAATGGTSGSGGSQSGTLPYTGSPIGTMVAVGLLVMGIGAALLQTARLRRS